MDGTLIGRGPATVQMSKRSSHSVMAKCGRSAGIAHIERSISATGILDLIGGVLILVPFIGATAPGFWRLEPPIVPIAIPDTSDCEIIVEGSPPSS